jgi:hypothetical protein
MTRDNMDRALNLHDDSQFHLLTSTRVGTRIRAIRASRTPVCSENNISSIIRSRSTLLCRASAHDATVGMSLRFSVSLREVTSRRQIQAFDRWAVDGMEGILPPLSIAVLAFATTSLAKCLGYTQPDQSCPRSGCLLDLFTALH